MKLEPRVYQPPAMDHLEQIPYGALWADMGLGKTVSALTAVDRLYDRIQIRRTLVIAPLRVARMVWAKECRKWDHLQHLRVQLIRHKDPEVRLKQALSEADIHVINFDLLVWLVKALGGRWPWDNVVLDEASKIKDPGSWRSRALWHVRPKISHLKELTGTPASKLRDVYGQVLLLDKGERLGRTEHQFLNRWFTKNDKDGRSWSPNPGALEHVVEQCRDICFSLRAEDYLDLPETVVNPVPVTLDSKRMAEYRKLEREMYLELESGAIDSVNAAVATFKCQQYANGAVWTKDENEQRKWLQIHDLKLEALQEVIDSAQGEPVIVAYWFKPDLWKLQKAFPQGETLDTEEDEDRWNRGEIPVLFLHPQSAGHGLNLQAGGRHIAFYSLTWSLESYQQIIERIGAVRQLQAGHPRPVYVHRIYAEGTVDELILYRLDTGASVQDTLKSAMRRRRT